MRWSGIGSAPTAVTYGASDGPHLRIAFPDTPMLGIWTKPGAHYVCVEPWHGIADPHGLRGRVPRQARRVRGARAGDEKRITMGVTLNC